MNMIRQPDGTFSVPDQEKKMSIPDHLQRAMLHVRRAMSHIARMSDAVLQKLLACCARLSSLLIIEGIKASARLIAAQR